MPNPTSLLADALGRNLAEAYRRNYGQATAAHPAGLGEVARFIIGKGMDHVTTAPPRAAPSRTNRHRDVSPRSSPL